MMVEETKIMKCREELALGKESKYSYILWTPINSLTFPFGGDASSVLNSQLSDTGHAMYIN